MASKSSSTGTSTRVDTASVARASAGAHAIATPSRCVTGCARAGEAALLTRRGRYFRFSEDSFSRMKARISSAMSSTVPHSSA